MFRASIACRSEMNKEACVALGLGGWACVTNVNKDGSTVILGFDAIGRPCRMTAAGELSLLRMALDTIVYALERHSMEKERARLEMRLQQARRMETVGTFSSGIAHNFNNILAGILGHTEMVEEHLASEARPRRNLTAIRRGAERARDLVDQILTFGRRREGRREHVCVKTLVAEAKSLLAPSLPAHVEIKVSETAETAAVSAEPAQLQQVILNICNNAVQAMDKPGVIEIEIGTREISDARRVTQVEINPGRFVVVSISDPGRGMDEATLERIFEPFFTTRPDGNGLGLATARDIVREHNGALQVSSTARGRDTFRHLASVGAVSSADIRSTCIGYTPVAASAKRYWCLKPTADACCVMRKFWPLLVMSRSASRDRRRLRKPAPYVRASTPRCCATNPARASPSISPPPCASSRPTCRSSWRRLRHGISTRNCWQLPGFPRSSIIR